ncbi:MAG: carboxypeptidase regulatory-like domain-containing protein [Bradymonadaceae bacterium]|nr:carboxypeptidase regulatory-like domain-containing protein [Lujinxingiaceae bacterium]
MATPLTPLCSIPAFVRLILLIGMATLFFSGCDCEGDTGSTPLKRCSSVDECSGTQACVNGFCQPGSDAGADVDQTNDVGSSDADAGGSGDADDVEGDVPCPHEVSCSAEGVACGSIPNGCGGTVHCGRCDDGFVCGSDEDRGKCLALECTPTGSCEGIECGSVPDGCGESIECGECSEGLNCGRGVDQGLCVDPGAACRPFEQCADANNAVCGSIPDGCGGLLECGSCADGKVCGQGAQLGRCVDLACTPRLVCENNIQCGSAPDGCGGTINCGGCANSQYCGLTGAERGQCITIPCTPILSCDNVAENCGMVANGCGGVVNCGGCGDGQVCGTDNVCVAKSCTPRACSATEVCGRVSNGCGGFNECGTCATGKVCGTGADLGKCLDPSCTPRLSCDNSGTICGPLADNCGGTIDCGGCGAGKICATGQCIDLPCTRATSCDAGDACGLKGDGCGGTIPCGSCTAPQICGTGADANRCVAPTCTPKTCADLGDPCGRMPNGCGGFIECASCGANQFCGTGANLGVCQNYSCTPQGCNGAVCGPVSDGCGGTIASCGTCGPNEVCGTGATRGQCGPTDCVKLTCADYGNSINCGPASDGCGGVTANCGTCQEPEICGGGGIANVCGATVRDGPCENLCLNQSLCAGGGATTIKGTVFAPNGTLPIPNAVVYVPNVLLANLPAIGSGASCVQCDEEDLGSPLAGTVSAFDGTFELRHVPAGVAFPLVIKIGKWRRVVMIPAQTACGSTELTSAQTRLPNRQGAPTDAVDVRHNNIPRTAFSTGRVDAMECVMRKIGVHDAEFTRHNATTPGRMHIYRANGGVADASLSSDCSTAGCGNSACTDRDQCSGGNASSQPARQRVRDNMSNVFYSDFNKLNGYDMVVFGCEATANNPLRLQADRTNMLNYLNGGGRLFASHFSFDWLYETDQLRTTATWGGTAGNESSTLAYVDDSFPRGATLWSWLQLVGATYQVNGVDQYGPLGEPIIAIEQPRYYVQSVNNLVARRWVYTQAGETGHRNKSGIQQYTFNTPVGADNDPQQDSCGRVVYSAFHVSEASTGTGQGFPGYCTAGELNAQEKVLAFMLFDLAGCVDDEGPPPPPICTAKTCASESAQCGVISDGCGNISPNDGTTCGSCPNGQACGAGGVPNQCGGPCRPFTCSELGAECGMLPDGCGGTITCEGCDDPEVCGGGGVANMCECLELSCADHNGAKCGTVSNGCGGTIACGDCAGNTVCGGNGTPNQCACPALTCESHGANCGSVSDGCGATLNCGSCAPGQICGGGGVANQCGDNCESLSCADHNAECGQVSNGCGGVIPSCGTCLVPGTQCNANKRCECTKLTCLDHGAQCGTVSDGCGGTLECNTCPIGSVCGGPGEPNKCVCSPLNCDDHFALCGAVDDGCGTTLQCGDCPAGTSCGGGGVRNVCDVSCEPLSCNDHGAQCGQVADGCGNTVTCDACDDGLTCGGGGQPNICGCEKLSCADHGASCGEVADGCGGVMACGVCAEGQACGAGGQPNVCADACVPLSCDDHAAQCGPVSDGCGGTVQCGNCPVNTTCGGGGVPNQCGDTCAPLSCADHGAECGTVSSGCGTSVACAACTDFKVCESNLCVVPPCKAAGAECDRNGACCSSLCGSPGPGLPGVCIVN